MGAFDESTARLLLSALADGEVGHDDGDTACKAWCGAADARRDWHTWHLIGDVLRSDDLASDPRGDARFCAAVSARLATVAVVLAPMPASASRSARVGASIRSNRLMFGSAVAAGFVLVAGTFTVLRPFDGSASTRLASADSAASTAAAPSLGSTTLAEGVPPSVAIVADSQWIRDAKLDRYLVAHKQFAGTSALGVPSAFLRSATVDSASR